MQITFKLIPTLAYVCVLPVLISLGVWQLNRAEQKQDFFKMQEQRLQSPLIDLTPDSQVDVELLKYSKVRVSGHYDAEHQFLLDNQISAGVAGYFVLTPFILDGSTKAVLINRGWIPLKDRSQLPQVNVIATQATVFGRINSFPGVGIKLAGAEIPTKSWPSVVGLLDNTILSTTVGYAIMPFQIELADTQPQGYKREWQETTLMRPEQHTAYAVQWFALALTLTFLFIRYSFKRD
jgi:surfeit locus 1 family protein